MFARWGSFVYRRRHWTAGLAVVVALASLLFASRASSVLSSGGWYDPSSESQQVADRLARDFGAGGTSLAVLFEAPGRTDAASPAFQSQIAAALAPLRADSRVAGIIGYAQTGAARFISQNGDASWVLVQLNLSEDRAVDALPSLRAEIDRPAGIQVSLTGQAAIGAAISAQSETDLGRAESISLPLTLVVLLLVFGSLVAAGLPLLVAGLAIPSTMAIVWYLAQFTTMSVFVTSVVTMLGLALAIDYSLFMVSRFREELRAGLPVEAAVARTVATSGKAVAFSGSAVAVGLSGLLFFRAPTLASMGIGGALVAAMSVVYALTFLPAVLGMLGPRVERLRVRLPRRSALASDAIAAAAVDAGQASSAGRWERLAGFVMRRPVAVIVPVLAVLLALGSPFLGVKQGLPGVGILPAGNEARQAWETIDTRFPAGETQPIDIIVNVSGDPLSAANVNALADYTDRIRSLAGVSRVDGPYALVDPATGRPLDRASLVATLGAPAATRPAALNGLLASSIRGSSVHLAAITPLAGDAAAQTLVQTIRSIPAPAGAQVAVGGTDAATADFLAAQDQSLPIAITYILLAMAVMLFLQFGSLVLPVKAVVMTLLSLTASFGALVWIFQDGNLASVLNFHSPGITIATVPILMFAVVFGLSMDYEVLLLSRIQEAYRRGGDTSQAVAAGLARTGRVITGAAVIMVGVFAAFGLADMIIIKSLGVALAIAVLLDATVIRALLVPATMRLLGRWNWWVPAPIGGLVERLGFSHLEAETAPAAFADEFDEEDGEAAVA